MSVASLCQLTVVGAPYMVVLSFFAWGGGDWAPPKLRDFPASFNRKRSVYHSISRLFERNWRSAPRPLREMPDPEPKVIFEWEHLHSILNVTCRGKSMYHGQKAQICGLSFFISKTLTGDAKPGTNGAFGFKKMHFSKSP